MNTLKPCPFCGKMPEVADDGVCRCNNKSCSMAPYWYLPKYWNIRPIEDALNTRIAELEAENDQLTARWRQERQDDKSPNDTQTQTFVYGKESEE